MLALVVFRYEIERAGIRGGNFTRLRENQSEQGVYFALRGESDANLIKLLALAFPILQSVAADAVAFNELDILEGSFESSFDDAGWGERRKKCEYGSVVAGIPRMPRFGAGTVIG
jgi:hypothetical protein